MLTNQNGVKQSAIEEYGNTMIPRLNYPVKQLWIEWQKLGTISKGKLNTLETDISSVNQYQATGFVARQLVETNQIAKLLAVILQGKYPNTKIIEIRKDQIQDVRMWLNLYRIPALNDYYRGYDAYLSAVIGNYLYAVYPKMRRYFVYNQYLKPREQDNKQDEENSAADVTNFNLLWQLLYGRKDSKHITVSKHTEEVLYNRDELIKYMKQVYSYKYQNVSYALDYLNGAVFKRTIYPRLERDTAKTRTLIPKKKNLDTSIYGGYTSNQNSYFILVRLEKKNKVNYKFFGVPVRYLPLLQQLKGKERYFAKLREIIEPDVGNVSNFRIIRDKVPYNQIIEDSKQKFYLGSVAYRYNARELVLDSQDQKVIMDVITDPEFNQHFATEDATNNLDEKLVKVYCDIVYQIKNYLQSMHMNKFVEKLEKAQSRFEKIPTAKKIHVIEQLLITTKCSATNGNLSDIGIGKLTFQKPGNPISENAKFITQSPTGLKETRISVQQMISKY